VLDVLPVAFEIQLGIEVLLLGNKSLKEKFSVITLGIRAKVLIDVFIIEVLRIQL